jgi:ATP synthase protein I
MVGQGTHLAKQAIALQLVCALIISLISLLFSSFPEVLNFLAGACISILPNIVFSYFAFRFAGATKSDLVMKSFSQGSKIKLALTLILFVIAYRFLPPHPVALLAGFAVALVTHTLAIIVLCKRSK